MACHHHGKAQRSVAFIPELLDKKFHPTRYNGCNYLSMLGLKLNMLVKGATGVYCCLIQDKYFRTLMSSSIKPYFV